MPRGPATFRERDIKAAIRAVKAAGEPVAGVEIDRDGRIRVIVGAPRPGAEATNPWEDED